MAKDRHGSGGGWRTESLLQSAIVCLVPSECVNWAYAGKLLKTGTGGRFANSHCLLHQDLLGGGNEKV